MSKTKVEDIAFDFSEKQTSSEKKEAKETSTEKPETKSPEEEVKLSPLELAQKETQEFKSQHAYLRAEFDNYKKNVNKEQLRLIRFGSENLILDMIKIADLFQLALQTKMTPENLDNIYTGLKMTSSELTKSLENHGLKIIQTKDLSFDPHLHEAIGSEKSESIPGGNIIKECKPGYTLHDKMIRPSQVIVSASEASSEDNEK